MRPIYFFWIIFAFATYCIGYLYQDFLINLLIAGLLCVASFWLKNFFDRIVSWNFFSSLCCVLVLLGFLIAPLYFALYQNLHLDFDMTDFSNFVELVKSSITRLLEIFPFLGTHIQDFVSDISAQSLMNFAIKWSSYIGKYSLNFIFDTTYILIFLFLFFYYGKIIYKYMLELLPFEKIISRKIFSEISGVLRVVFLTSVVNIFLQGFAFGIAVAFLGYDGLALGIFYGLASLIPIVGGALLWVPISGYELYLGHKITAIFISLYSLVFIGFVIDNLIKPFIISFIKQKILKASLQINEILIFFSILAGFSTFGFWGIVIGPAITAFFLALLHIYKSNFIK